MTARSLTLSGFAAALLSLGAMVAATEASQAKMEVGVERPGGTYAVKDKLADENACKAECDGDARCVAYTFMRSGFQGDKTRCWLKEEITPTWKTSEQDCCVSGVKEYKGATGIKVFENISVAGPEGSTQAFGLDLCKEGGIACGWPAANAFCKSKGLAKAVDYQVTRDMPPTRAIGDGFVCNRKFCHRISTVVCASGAALTSD